MTVRQRLVNTPLDIGNLAVAKGRCQISREPCLPSRRQNIGRKSRAPNACQAPVSALAGSGPFAAIQTIFATILAISSAEKARNVLQSHHNQLMLMCSCAMPRNSENGRLREYAPNEPIISPR
jgi:hypothetical protein